MLNNVMTFKEASERWNVPVATLRTLALGQKGYPPKFKEGEIAKSGGHWLVTLEAMERVYGSQKNR